MLYKINKIKSVVNKNDLLKANFGVERESLRTDRNGDLSKKPHSKSFGYKIFNPYITTDFSESQLELITPTLKTSKEVYDFLNVLYDIVALENEDEFIWPQSMPCVIPSDDEIPIATYCGCSDGFENRKYREELVLKYGAKKQLISGIHYNFSFNEELLKKLHKLKGAEIDFKTFKNNVYLKVSRNYIRYRWLLVYLFGCSSVFHETYDKCDCKKEFSKLTKDTYLIDKSISYRNSECGYKNNIDLFPNYSSVDDYIKSINDFLDKNLIKSHKELYAPIRLKAKNPKDFLNSLKNDGINYLEYRNIDINPFEKCGISLFDLEFLNLFSLYLLFEDETDFKDYQKEALFNQNKVASEGLGEIYLTKENKKISLKTWAFEILEKIKVINNEFDLGKNDEIESIIEKIKNVEKTYSFKLINKIRENGYVNFHIKLAEKYKKQAYTNRFKLQGFEDLELSTQILIKEAIKRGIKYEIIDRSDNFISLTQNYSNKPQKVEYVKQATKTSKDNYVTVLAMENKVVTKKILQSSNIKVPSGFEYDNLEDAVLDFYKFENKALVIKPKSTNFGTGISIFPDGTNKENLKKAFEIAFKHDDTVLVEEFVKGKEYRFLVVGDKVLGVLHRVPANVKGDGVKSIKELVEIKNQSSLRGKGYKTPLEKIDLDENAKLFLKHKNLDFNYVPKSDEVVYLRENSNISTGGDSIDYTDKVCDKFKEISVCATKAVGAKICGVDMIIENLDDKNSNYSIIELNFNPAIHIHSYPYVGEERQIAKEILKLLEFEIF